GSQLRVLSRSHLSGGSISWGAWDMARKPAISATGLLLRVILSEAKDLFACRCGGGSFGLRPQDDTRNHTRTHLRLFGRGVRTSIWLHESPPSWLAIRSPSCSGA